MREAVVVRGWRDRPATMDPVARALQSADQAARPAGSDNGNTDSLGLPNR